MTEVVTATPLADTLARLDATMSWGSCRVGLPDETGWWRCDQLLDDPAGFDTWRDAIAVGLARHHGVEVPVIVPSAYQLLYYADVVAWVAAAVFHRERRVPNCAPDALAFAVDDDAYPARVAQLDPRFACLPDDPAADHPDATVLPDEAALALHLQAAVRSHAQRFLEVWVPPVRLGRRTRWGAFSDALDSAPWAAGMGDGDEEAGVRSARVLLAQGLAPLVPGSRIYQGRDDRGRPFWSRYRHTCCFAYRLPPGEACFSCPRTSDAERSARAATWPDGGPEA
jgi:hypothetical protein